MAFPLITINPEDRVICLFREGWRFGLFADFNPKGEFDREAMERDLGTLLRRMRYRDLCDAIGNPDVFQRIMDAGWFPFAEIIGTEFMPLGLHAESGFALDEEGAKLITRFTQEPGTHVCPLYG